MSEESSVEIPAQAFLESLGYTPLTAPQADALRDNQRAVLTDRRDLDTQISSTFRACGLPNPEHAGSIRKLQAMLAQKSPGRTITSTIFKFDVDDERLLSDRLKDREAAVKDLAIDESENWILLVDECHRTQEELLGAYLRATFPNAYFFGFTGTPVKKNDKDTYANFGAPGEGYLDKYGIDQAVRDKATVEAVIRPGFLSGISKTKRSTRPSSATSPPSPTRSVGVSKSAGYSARTLRVCRRGSSKSPRISGTIIERP